MKILEFTLPVPVNKSIITKEEKLSNFYPYLHRHNEVQLTWIINGEGTLVTGSNMHNFHANQIFWIGANQPHVFKSTPDCFENSSIKTHSIDIFFSIDAQLLPFFSVPEFNQLKKFIQEHNQGFCVPANKIEEVSEKMKQIRKTEGIEQLILFFDLLRSVSSIQDLTPLSCYSEFLVCKDSEGIRIANIYNYILKNYRDAITLEQIAGMAFMTPQAFCRYFKKHTHNTLVGFINQVRVNEACRQLTSNNNETIACIAYNTGFNTITNFNRVFKSVVKKSPKEYLENYRKQVN